MRDKYADFRAVWGQIRRAIERQANGQPPDPNEPALNPRIINDAIFKACGKRITAGAKLSRLVPMPDELAGPEVFAAMEKAVRSKTRKRRTKRKPPPTCKCGGKLLSRSGGGSKSKYRYRKCDTCGATKSERK